MDTDQEDTITMPVPTPVRKKDDDEDESLDEAAQGTSETSDEAPDGSEIDAIGRAAGFVERDDKPFRGIEEIERRDIHRWNNLRDTAEFSTD